MDIEWQCDHRLELSYDEGKTWESLGIKATGADGAADSDDRNGKDGADGKDANTTVLLISLALGGVSLISNFVLLYFVLNRKKNRF